MNLSKSQIDLLYSLKERRDAMTKNHAYLFFIDVPLLVSLVARNRSKSVEKIADAVGAKPSEIRRLIRNNPSRVR